MLNRNRFVGFLDRALPVLFWATLALTFLRPSWLKFATPFGRLSLTSAKNIALLLCAVWLSAALLDPRRYLARCGMEWPVILFVAAGCLSALLSPFGDPGERWEAVGEAVFYAVFFRAALSLLRAPSSRRGAAFLLFIAAAVVAAADLGYHWSVGIWRTVDQGYPFWDGKNALGLFMVLALALMLPALAAAGGRRGWTAAALLPCVLLIFLCAVYSYSRGAWVALGGAAVVLTVLRSWKWTAALILAAIAALVILPHRRVVNRAVMTGSPRDYNAARRVEVWKCALLMVRDRALTGVGPGVFRRACPVYEERLGLKQPPGGGPGRARYREHAHNLFLQVAAETGIIGLIALLWGAAVVSAAARRRLRSVRDPCDLALAQGITVALAAFAVFSCADSSWNGRFVGGSFMHVNLTVALLVAMLFSMEEGGAGERPAQ